MSWDAPTPPTPPSALLVVSVVMSALLLIDGTAAVVVQSSASALLPQQPRGSSAATARWHHLRSTAYNSSIEERMLRIEEIKNRIRASFGAMLLPSSATAAAAAEHLGEEGRRRIRAELHLRETLAADESSPRGRAAAAAANDASSLDLYSFRQLKGDDDDDDGGGSNFRFRFDVDIPRSDEAGRRNRVESAMLHLYKKAVRPHNLRDNLNVAANVAVSVHQLLAGGLRRLIGVRVVSLAERGWISLDVTEAVRSWLDEPPEANRGRLLVDAAPPNNLSALLDFAGGGGGGDYDEPSAWTAHSREPLLDVRVYQQQQQRRRRPQKLPSPSRTSRARRDAASDDGGGLLRQKQQPKRPGSPRRGLGGAAAAGSERCVPGQCCRKRLTISFAEDLDWKWVVGPAKFDAYYCEGGCVGDYKAANNFAEVKKALRRVGRVSPSPRSHCTPTRYKPLSIAHLDARGELIITEKRDMIVEECGCA